MKTTFLKKELPAVQVEVGGHVDREPPGLEVTRDQLDSESPSSSPSILKSKQNSHCYYSNIQVRTIYVTFLPSTTKYGTKYL